MVDVHDSRVRSRNMSAIKSGNTKPEILVRKWLHALGYRFRIHRTDLPGNPDIVLPKYRVAIFVNGCFWHKHECHLFKWPGTRQSWWESKLRKTAERDLVKQEELLMLDWRVFVIWECALRGNYRVELSSLMSEFETWLRGTESKGEAYSTEGQN